MDFGNLREDFGNLVFMHDEEMYKIYGSPYFWRRKAEEMKFIVETLSPTVDDHITQLIVSIDKDDDSKFLDFPPNIFEAVLAHMGYSLECLLKGVIIQNNPSYISNGVMAKHLKSHDLVNLLKLSKIEFNSHDLHICRLCMSSIEKYRYPIPKQMGEQTHSMMSLGKDCREAFKDLYDKLYPLSSKLGKRDVDQ